MEREARRINPIEISTAPSCEIPKPIMDRVTEDLVTKITYLNQIAKLEGRDIKIEHIVARDINFLIWSLDDESYLAGLKSIETNGDIRIYFDNRWIKVPDEVGGVNLKTKDFNEIQKIHGVSTGRQAIGVSCFQGHLKDWYFTYGRYNRYLVRLDEIKKITLATHNSGR